MQEQSPANNNQNWTQPKPEELVRAATLDEVNENLSIQQVERAINPIEFAFDEKSMRWRKSGEDGKLGKLVSAKDVPESYFANPNNRSTANDKLSVDEIYQIISDDSAEIDRLMSKKEAGDLSPQEETDLRIFTTQRDNLQADLANEPNNTTIAASETQPSQDKLSTSMSSFLALDKKGLKSRLSEKEAADLEGHVVGFLNAHLDGTDILEGMTLDQQEDFLLALQLEIAKQAEQPAEEIEAYIDSIRHGSPSYRGAITGEATQLPKQSDAVTTSPEITSETSVKAAYEASLDTDFERLHELADIKKAGNASEEDLKEMTDLARLISSSNQALNTLEGLSAEDQTIENAKLNDYLSSLIASELPLPAASVDPLSDRDRSAVVPMTIFDDGLWVDDDKSHDLPKIVPATSDVAGTPVAWPVESERNDKPEKGEKKRSRRKIGAFILGAIAAVSGIAYGVNKLGDEKPSEDKTEQSAPNNSVPEIEIPASAPENSIPDPTPVENGVENSLTETGTEESDTPPVENDLSGVTPDTEATEAAAAPESVVVNAAEGAGFVKVFNDNFGWGDKVSNATYAQFAPQLALLQGTYLENGMPRISNAGELTIPKTLMNEMQAFAESLQAEDTLTETE